MKNSVTDIYRKRCPETISILRYVLKMCSDKERQEIEVHLLECSYCRKETVAFANSELELQDEESRVEIPDGVFHKIMQKMSDTKKIGLLEIFIQFINGKWENTRHTGFIIPQVVLASKGEGTKQTFLSLGKEFQGCWVEVNVDGDMEGMIDLHITVKNAPKGDPLPKIDLTLTDTDTEETFTTCSQDGTISCEDLSFGGYAIEIAKQGKTIANISLNLQK
ncbi:MAG: zf-HC2 domain-containing protein [bacterium]